jgi:hypothetical protein
MGDSQNASSAAVERESFRHLQAGGTPICAGFAGRLPLVTPLIPAQQRIVWQGSACHNRGTLDDFLRRAQGVAARKRVPVTVVGVARRSL